jgi:hypothetical protein
MLRRAVLSSIAVLAGFGFSGAIAQPDSCGSDAGQLAPDRLYVAMPCADHPNSQCQVPAESAALKQNVPYHFLYKTSPTDILRSLVVVQLKGVAAQPVAAPVAVSVSRHRLSFACYRNPLKLFRVSIYTNLPHPPDADGDSAGAGVPYSNYDHFNRYGDTSMPSQGVLWQIHTNYSNGAECVSTLETVRRAQFLFTNRDQVPGFFVALGTDVGIKEPVAIAAEINKYNHLQVIVTNYEKPDQTSAQAQTSACIRFVARSYSPALEINLSDLEQKVRTPDLYEKFHPRVWLLQTP